jgi:hypothetical protein
MSDEGDVRCQVIVSLDFRLGLGHQQRHGVEEGGTFNVKDRVKITVLEIRFNYSSECAKQ